MTICNKATNRILSYFFTILFSITIISCGSSSSLPAATTIIGTAATGQAIAGFVYVIDASGVEVNEAISGNGSFVVTVTGMTPPFMIKVVPNDTSIPPLFSYSATAGQTVNVTPMTNLAMFLAGANTDLDTIFNNWDGSGITSAAVIAAQKKINANLQTQFTAASLDATTYDFFLTPFLANSTGLDAILDIMSVVLNPSAGSFTLGVNSTPFAFNESINTSGINIGGSSGNNTLGENETVATIPSSIADTYELTFSESTAGSGIADGTTTTFVVATDGSLTFGSTVLTNPVLYLGNAHEAIWFDTTNNLQYALSSLVSGFNEINISSGVHYDQPGFTFYGQYRGAPTGPIAFVCAELAGKLTLSGDATNLALTGDTHCPNAKPTPDSNLNNEQLTFQDSGGPTDFSAHPASNLTIYEEGGIGSGTTGVMVIKYSTGGNQWTLRNLSTTLASLGVTIDTNAKTLTFNPTSVILPAEAGNAVDFLSLSGTLSYQ